MSRDDYIKLSDMTENRDNTNYNVGLRIETVKDYKPTGQAQFSRPMYVENGELRTKSSGHRCIEILPDAPPLEIAGNLNIVGNELGKVTQIYSGKPGENPVYISGTGNPAARNTGIGD